MEDVVQSIAFHPTSKYRLGTGLVGRSIGLVDPPIKARLDARGLVCPLPVLKANEVLSTLQPGERLEVLADDPVAPLDFEAFSLRSGHPLRESSADSGTFRFVLEHK